jgi:hypothetical protein
MFGKFISDWLRRNSRHRRQPARYKPVVHELESRLVPSTFNEFPIPAVSRDFRPEFPRFTHITAGPDGNLWYTATIYDPGIEVVGRITLEGTVTNFTRPGIAGGASDVGAITAGSDGNLWFGHANNFSQGISRITPDGGFLPDVPGSQRSKAIVTGSDGNVWTVASDFSSRTDRIEQITPDGQITEYPLPTPRGVSGITIGPDGNIWFTEFSANQIGMITPDGQINEYPIPTPNSRPEAITAGPDGNVWFTELGSNQIGEFVLNDGDSAARAASAQSAPLAQAVHAAAVDAFFASAQPDPLKPAFVNQQPARAVVDAAFAARPPDAVTVPTGSQVQTAASDLPHLHTVDQAPAVDLVGLADPLTEAP